MSRLSFRWWGTFWRGWFQWGRVSIVADKDYDVTATGFMVGPIEINWWSRSDWRAFCFTPEEAAAEDARDRAELGKTSEASK